MQTTKTDKSNLVGFEEILKGIRQLDDQSLTQVAGEVTRLLSERSDPTPGDREIYLSKKIKTAIPSPIKRRQKQLYTRLQQDALSQKEYEELLLLNHLLEEKSAERILLMEELAKLRGVSVQQIVSEFKGASMHAKA